MVGIRRDCSTRPFAASPDASCASEAAMAPVRDTGPVGALAAGSSVVATHPRTTITAPASEEEDPSITGETTQKPSRSPLRRSEMNNWSAAGPQVPATVTRRPTAFEGSPSLIEKSDSSGTGAPSARLAVAASVFDWYTSSCQTPSTDITAAIAAASRKSPVHRGVRIVRHRGRAGDCGPLATESVVGATGIKTSTSGGGGQQIAAQHTEFDTGSLGRQRYQRRLGHPGGDVDLEEPRHPISIDD